MDSILDNAVPSVQVGNNTLYPELRTPKLCGLSAVRYEILDLDRHMDSSEMTPKGEYHGDSLGGPMLLVMCYGKVWFLRPSLDQADIQNGTTLRNWSKKTGRPTTGSSFYLGPTLLYVPSLIGGYLGKMREGAKAQAYTSSILSFLFTNIGKPILITGAQIPLSQSRSDGWDNILDSLVVAGVLDFAGVGVVFNHQVLQGNR